MIPSPEAVERHPHLALPQPAGHVRVDMHSHTMWSGDCTTTLDELVPALEASGLDVICVTDHNATAGAFALAERLDGKIRVVVGEEVRIGGGELIGLFLSERIAPGPSAIEIARSIRGQGGLVYVPHPFDPMRNGLPRKTIDELLDLGLIDAFEVWNAKTSLASLNAEAARFADQHSLAAGAGSDAHVPEALGAAYVEMPDFETSDDFLAALGQGNVFAHYCDPVRAWSPRIVPSTEGGP